MFTTIVNNVYLCGIKSTNLSAQTNNLFFILMQNYTIIISTIINSQEDLKGIQQVINRFPSISEWSHDLDDCDKVLRIVSEYNVSKELIEQLNTFDIMANVMEIFQKEPLKADSFLIL